MEVPEVEEVSSDVPQANHILKKPFSKVEVRTCQLDRLQFAGPSVTRGSLLGVLQLTRSVAERLLDIALQPSVDWESYNLDVQAASCMPRLRVAPKLRRHS